MTAASIVAWLLLDLAPRAAVWTLLALFVHAALGRRPSGRSAVWHAWLLGLVLVVPVALAMPRWRVVCLPAIPNRQDPGIDEALVHEPARPPDNEVGLARPRVTPVEGGVSSTGLPAPPAPMPVATAAPPSSDGWTWTWPRMCLTAYAVGVVLSLVRFGCGLGAVRRLRRSARPVVDASWVEGLERCRAVVGLSRRVLLATSPRVGVPVVVGGSRPMIVLPGSLAGSVERGAIDAVLIHELAHVVRNDYAWNLLLRLVRAAYWPHPLVWLGGALAKVERERACDDYCIHVLGGPNVYKTTLLDIAGTLTRSAPWPALGMAMARTSSLARRIAWIDSSDGSSRCRPSSAARLVLAVATLVVVGLLAPFEPTRAEAPPAPAPSPSPSPPATKAAGDSGVLEVRIVDKESGRPLPGAWARFWVEGRKKPPVQADVEGKVSVDWSFTQPRGSLLLDVWREGHVQQRWDFRNVERETNPLPKQLRVELLPGSASFGGVVNDERGRPVAGVTVRLWGHLAEKQASNELLFMTQVTTGPDGRWRTRSARPMKFLNVYLEHPDYASDETFTDRRYEPPTAALRDGTDVQVLPRGVDVEGLVVDPDGRPVPGARVRWTRGANFFEEDQLNRATTDAGGRFRFPHAKPGMLTLLVVADGKALKALPVEAKPGLAPLSVRLERGRVLTGRVHDDKGDPIPGATVDVDRWNDVSGLAIRRETDPDGRFRWDGAPEDRVHIMIHKRGYIQVAFQPATPGKDEDFTLSPSITFSGNFTDARTGKPIRLALVESGLIDASGKTTWLQQASSSAAAGWYFCQVDSTSATSFKVRLSASGFKPLESPVYSKEASEVVWNAALEPSDRASSVVIDPSGRPLPGAEVYLLTPQSDFRLTGGKAEVDARSFHATTAADGAFSLPAIGSPAVLVAVHDRFFGIATREEVEAGKTLRVRPWGRVEGTVRIGSKLGAGEAVRLEAFRPDVGLGLRFSVGNRATADASGRFVIERVPPGRCRIARWPGDGPDRPYWSVGTPITVRAGQTTSVDLGGSGRPLVGRFQLPAGGDDAARFVAENNAMLESNRPDLPVPIATIREAEKKPGALRERISSRAGQAEDAAFVRRSVNLEPDGSFRFDDVASGVYRLRTNPKVSRRNREKSLEYLSARLVTVPPIPGGRSDEPLDLGVVPVWRPAVLKAGDPAPEFEVKSIDGLERTLASYRGKFLLLDFGSPWDLQSRFQVTRLDGLWATFGPSDRFAILSLVIDADTPDAQAFAREKAQPWPQAVIGPVAPDNPLTRAYGLGASPFSDGHGPPRAFLIGPDGRIVTQAWANLEEVRKALVAAIEAK